MENGFDIDGYNRKGYNRAGYDREGYDYGGYNQAGYDREGYNRQGYNMQGYDREGYDRQGFDVEGYNRQGFNAEGYDRLGFDKKGFDKDGNRRPRNAKELERLKNFVGLKELFWKIAKDEITMEDYVRRAKTSFDELLTFARSQQMPAGAIIAFEKRREEYKTVKTPFSRAKFLKESKIMVGDQEVKPTNEDVDKCLEFLKENNVFICDRYVRDTVIGYIRGEIDITRRGIDPNEYSAKPLRYRKKKLQNLKEEKAKIDAAEELLRIIMQGQGMDTELSTREAELTKLEQESQELKKVQNLDKSKDKKSISE